MKKLCIRLLFVALTSVALCCVCQQLSLTDIRTVRLAYQPARRDSTVDVYHGNGKPISKVLDEQADICAFVFKALNMSYRNARETHPRK